MKYRARHLIEYAVLKSVFAVIRVLPYRLALGLGWLLARVAFHLVRLRRTETLGRIHEVLGEDYPARKAKRVAWLSLRNLCFNVVEIVRMTRFKPDWLARVNTLHDEQNFWDAWDGKQGAILALAHQGNWDLAGLLAKARGIPLLSIAARQRNPLIDRELNRMRDVTGMETLLRQDRGLVRQVLKGLKQGKVLAILVDLRAPTPALDVPFLGKTANIAPGLGVFAFSGRVPVIPVVIRRKGWARHEWTVHPAIYPDGGAERATEVLRVTTEVLAIMDRAIREEPGQYFWYNRRWVLQPVRPVEP